jgi:hypothetical protein
MNARDSAVHPGFTRKVAAEFPGVVGARGSTFDLEFPRKLMTNFSQAVGGPKGSLASKKIHLMGRVPITAKH